MNSKLKEYVKFLLKKSYREEITRLRKENSIVDINRIKDNPDVEVLIIKRLNTKVGCFSDFIVFLKAIEYALEVGKIPIIDRKSVKNDFMPADDNTNSWELFFQQPCSLTLEEIDYNKMNVSVCCIGNGFYPVSIIRCKDKDTIYYWRQFAKKYIRIQPDLKERIKKTYDKLLKGKRVLGVSIREGYQKLVDMGSGTIWGHPKQMSLTDTLNIVEAYLTDWNLDYVFFTCQTIDTVEAFKKRFGEYAICINRKRVYYKDLLEGNKLKESLCFEDAKNNEEDYIIEISLLSKCNSMICSENSGSEAAYIMSDGFEHFWCYENGLYS